MRDLDFRAERGRGWAERPGESGEGRRRALVVCLRMCSDFEVILWGPCRVLCKARWMAVVSASFRLVRSTDASCFKAEVDPEVASWRSVRCCCPRVRASRIWCGDLSLLSRRKR